MRTRFSRIVTNPGLPGVTIKCHGCTKRSLAGIYPKPYEKLNNVLPVGSVQVVDHGWVVLNQMRNVTQGRFYSKSF